MPVPNEGTIERRLYSIAEGNYEQAMTMNKVAYAACAELEKMRAALDRIAFCGAGEDYRTLREIARVALQPST